MGSSVLKGNLFLSPPKVKVNVMLFLFTNVAKAQEIKFIT
jgi:hypothetical protein